MGVVCRAVACSGGALLPARQLEDLLLEAVDLVALDVAVS